MERQPRSPALVAMLAVVATIKEMGATGAPSGVLYAGVMDRVTFEEYQHLIAVLKSAGRVAEQGHVLYWIEQEQGEPS